MRHYLFSVFLILSVWGCVDPPDYSNEPEIESVGLNKSIMKQGKVYEDTLLIRISFTDGDGDLGTESVAGEPTSPNVFLIDSRDGFVGQTFQIPFIPEEGAGNGISGTIDLKAFTSCCLFDDGTVPCGISPNKTMDTLYYTLYIEDRAGHKSNEIEVGPIYLRCG